MDNRSIFSKTGKGSLEITKKTIKLSSEERQALILVDGKSNFDELQEKLSRVPAVKLRAVFEKLAGLELIREFVTKAAPAASSAGSAPEPDGDDELDFTSFAAPASKPAAPASSGAAKPDLTVSPSRRAAEPPRATTPAPQIDAAEEARKFQEMMFGGPQADPQAEAAEAAEAEALRKAEVARKVAEDQARRKVEAERIAREQAARKAAEDEAQRKAADEEARRHAESERATREAAARQAADDEARRKAEAERVAGEEAARKAEIERIEREAREREEAARRAAEEEARRKAEAERLAREEAARKAAEEEARRKAEAERIAREEAARNAEAERIEREAREREEAARRAAEEEARRKAEAERIAREERETAAREEAQRRAEAERISREAREREDAAHGKAEADRIARDERERQEREQLARDQAARRAAEEEAQRRAKTAQSGADEAELKRKADEEAARYLAALTPQIEAASAAPAPAESASLDFNTEAKAAFDADLNFAPQTEAGQRKAEVDRLMIGAFADPPTGGSTPLTSGGPDTFTDSGNTVDPITDSGDASRKELESASRKEIEREAKERAKADAKARKEAEKEAKLLAKASKVSVRGGGGPSVMTMIIGVVLVAVIGAVAYLFMMPIDKPAIERTLTERLGETVTIGTAKFSPFPPQLDLTNVVIGSIKLGHVVANPDPATLNSDRKIWKSVDVSGASLSADDARKLTALALRDVPKSAAAKAEIQRIKISGVDLTGLPVAVPKFDVVVLLTASGGLKQVTLSLPDGKAQAILTPDEKGWAIDLESRGVAWPVGPKISWESLRGKGIATSNGIKFDEYTITQFGGSGSGAGELTWTNGWKFAGNVDASGFDAEALGQAFYGAAPVSGGIDGKFSLNLNGNSFARLFDTPQIDGAFIANKAVVKSVDLARTAQTGTATAGATRFSDFSATLAAAGGKLQIKELKGISGLLTVSGTAEVLADKNLGGALTIELGVGGSRAKAIVKLSGTLAEPKFSK